MLVPRQSFTSPPSFLLNLNNSWCSLIPFFSYLIVTEKKEQLASPFCMLSLNLFSAFYCHFYSFASSCYVKVKVFVFCGLQLTDLKQVQLTYLRSSFGLTRDAINGHSSQTVGVGNCQPWAVCHLL